LIFNAITDRRGAVLALTTNEVKVAGAQFGSDAVIITPVLMLLLTFYGVLFTFYNIRQMYCFCR